MSDDKGHDSTPAVNTAAPVPATQPDAVDAKAGAENLTGLMAAGAKVAADQPAGRAGPDLDGDALRAAEQALAEGERALAAARAQLHGEPKAAPASTGNRREIALRALLAINVLAMLVVALLPPAAPTTVTPAPVTKAPHGADDPQVRHFNEPFNNALAAADRGQYPEAITILERYLADSPRMAPSQRLNVFNMLSHYAGLAKDFAKSQAYAQQAAAIGQSHSLPADLVEMAKAALASGDQESLRRVWARFLLQQRQIPTWLYKHVAEAYLQLGDSYRKEADDAAERARLQELQETAARLREQALQDKEKGK